MPTRGLLLRRFARRFRHEWRFYALASSPGAAMAAASHSSAREEPIRCRARREPPAVQVDAGSMTVLRLTRMPGMSDM